MGKDTQKYVKLRIPEEDWELLAETLHMDSKSSTFDHSLRNDIAKALDNIQYEE